MSNNKTPKSKPSKDSVEINIDVLPFLAASYFASKDQTRFTPKPMLVKFANGDYDAAVVVMPVRHDAEDLTMTSPKWITDKA